MSSTEATGEFAFVPLGVGDAFSSRYYSSCLYLSYGGSKILVDCPHPIRKIMAEASGSSGMDIRAKSIDGIVLTHLHADHCSGLEGIGFYGHYVTKMEIKLCAHDAVMSGVWVNHLAGTMAPLSDPPQSRRSFEDFFTPVNMTEEKPGHIGPFTVECRRTHHHVPTCAVKVTAGGKTLGYSSDTAYDEGLIDWLSSADLIIHETNVATHTPYANLAALPADIRAKMRLIHYPDDFDKESSVIEPLEQGVRYIVQ